MSRRVFVVNCGSSSLKYKLVDAESQTAHEAGLIERVTDYEQALRTALASVDQTGLVAVAHRVVHGGERFSAPALIDDGVVAAIRELGVLAPLHNGLNADGIDAARRVLPRTPHVAVFDTAFHHTLPPAAYTYAVPAAWSVRRYGFHGTSHAFVSRAAARFLGRAPEETNLIVLHLGNGASATAVAGGRSVDTSMGLTPLEGLVMGTRSGDVDPALVPHLVRAGLDVTEIEDGLNRRSGMLALAGAGDLREVHRRAAAGDARADLALEVYCHRIRKYVGAYLAVLGSVDAVVFTAGVGEHDAVVRARSLAGLEGLGIAVDDARNAAVTSEARAISPAGARVAVLVIPTDEELEMAIQADALVCGFPATGPAVAPDVAGPDRA